jgi:two-component system, chemotaxis family, chemotaxis protein CheY
MNVHAMVVDDSGVMRRMVMRALLESKLADFVFTEAVDGADALAKFDPQVIQMLFVDWNMPNMTGIDLVRKIRQTSPAHVPIVMITTEGTMARVEEALNQCGVDSYVVKPFTAETLCKKLEPLFQKLQDENAENKAPQGFFGRLAAKLS